MTRRLARLADIAYRRRGRMVLAWIVATVVADRPRLRARRRVQRRLQHAGLGVEGGERTDQARFGGYSGQEIYVVWKDPQGADSPATKQADGRLPRPGRRGRPRRRAGARSASPRTARSRLDDAAADGRRAGTSRRSTAKKLIAAAEDNNGDGLADQARRRTDLRRAGADQPRGARLPRRRDRAADRLRLARRRRACRC